MAKMSERMGQACCGEEENEMCVELPSVGAKLNISSGEDAFTAYDAEEAWAWHDYEAAKREELVHA